MQTEGFHRKKDQDKLRLKPLSYILQKSQKISKFRYVMHV